VPFLQVIRAFLAPHPGSRARRRRRPSSGSSLLTLALLGLAFTLPFMSIPASRTVTIHATELSYPVRASLDTVSVKSVKVDGPYYTHHEFHEMHLSHLRHLAWLKQQAAAAAWAAAHPAPKPVVQSVAVVQAAPIQQAPSSHVSTAGDGSFQACVISRESGGNADIWNASGHWGLYQFSESTWIAYGGSASEFGSASVAEQNRVFDNAIAAGGQSNWSPYDGC
jgi:hypothetical protein